MSLVTGETTVQNTILDKEIPLESIRDNPYNPRRVYDEGEIRSLADSIAAVGLLDSVRVRPNDNGFELVYGHRRVRAVRLLNWKTIRATIEPCSNEQLLRISVVENLSRKDLSDYEKALAFKQMHEEFGRTDEEIGLIVGLSKGHVSNYISMARLFTDEQLASDPSLKEVLYAISEHHTRYLSRIEDFSTRANTLRMVVSQNLSVRDLQRVIQHLRSWFKPEKESPLFLGPTEWEVESHRHNNEASDLREIEESLTSKFVLPKEGNFRKFVDLLALDDGYSLYSAFPPFHRIDGSKVLEKEKNWFTNIVANFTPRIRDLRIQIFNDAALATLYVDYMGKSGRTLTKRVVRGSVVFVRNGRSWRIVHEHWSDLRHQR
ncbi:MAG: ParB/RepB/Spo0J family partition protein [Nitrososphaerales archaeon]|jgi:ParB/RepB/Spo0J family partition protein